MSHMVAGFLFWSNQVLLVRKTRPAWQAGLYNAVGGHVEDGEHPLEAMVREFCEETSLEQHTNWDWFATEQGADYHVTFFRLRASADLPRPVTPPLNDWGEELEWMPWSLLGINKAHPMVGNLRWLLPMALDWRRMSARVVVTDDIRKIPYW